MSDNPPSRKRHGPGSKERGAPLWVTSLFLVVLVCLVVWIGNWFIEFDDLQRCLSAGHRDCVDPIEPGK